MAVEPLNPCKQNGCLLRANELLSCSSSLKPQRGAKDGAHGHKPLNLPQNGANDGGHGT